MRRLTVEGFTGWTSDGAPGEAVLLVFPDADGQVRLPDEREDDPYERARWYTVRGWDAAAGRLTLDLVHHDAGESARWARRARPGDVIGVSSSRSWYARPADGQWQVLVGDLTALPAISRAIESHTDGSPLHAYVEVPGPADAQPLELPAGARITWWHQPDDHTSRLGELFAGVQIPDGPGYVFVAGEAAGTREARRLLRHQQGRSADRYCVTSYWRVRSREWLDRFAAVQDQLDLQPLYEQMEVEGADTEALADEVDRRLATAGL